MTPASPDPPPTPSFPRFPDLPPELRIAIWQLALPAPRTIVVLVYAFPGFKLAPLNRKDLEAPALARTCGEARRVLRESGYGLAFRDEDDPRDAGVWFNPSRDTLERTLWGPGENWGLR
ncbi:hypothetical protein LQW54_011084 [Pestalotiopsis sp. IQ-011]